MPLGDLMVKSKIFFFSAKDTVKRMKRQATDWAKIFAQATSDKAGVPNPWTADLLGTGPHSRRWVASGWSLAAPHRSHYHLNQLLPSVEKLPSTKLVPGSTKVGDRCDKGLLSKIYKELLQFDSKKTKQPDSKMGQRPWLKPHQRRHMMANKHMKRYSTSHVIREMQIKIMIRYNYIPIRMAKIQNTDSNKCWQRGGATRILINCRWESKIVQPRFRRQFGTFLQN